MIEMVRTQWDRGIRSVKQDTSVLWIFAATIFLSALLLFSVQPIFAKMVLPQLGGTPAVWAVSMCFFQAALLAGYCYAHVLNRFVAPRIAPIVHVAMLAAAYLALPFGLPAGAEPPPGDAYFWLIHVLAVGVGLPFFVVSANAPLLQAWFARSGHPHAGDPYFLYGASNLGSLLALLAYPVVMEPNLGLAAQSNLWTFGFVALGLAIATSALAMVFAADARGISLETVSRSASAVDDSATAITLRDRLYWLGLAFVPSGLLVAFTTHLTTDIASAPFLWVLPLAAFLATFIVVFRDKPLIPDEWLQQSIAPLIAVGVLSLATPILGRTPLLVAGSALAALVVMLVAHRELYQRRPVAAKLTEFYIWMSLGGVLGGIFAAMAAPQVFNTVAEYPLLLVLGLGCRRGALGPWTASDRRQAVMLAIAAVAVIVFASILGGLLQSSADQIRSFVLLLALVPMLFWRREMLRPLVVGGAAFLGLQIMPGSYPATYIERSFFGVHRVSHTSDGQFRVVLHGTTIHGAERIKTPSGGAITVPVPATYYAPKTPMSDGFDLARAATGKLNGGLRIGVVGLGAGSLACYAKPGEQLRLFEIDPVVAKIARSDKFFRFLPVCQPVSDIVIGDARLTLAKQQAGSFDYLVIDAFSSDAVPVHMLTAEAIAMFLTKLTGNGILALHVSNQFMDLDTVAAVTAKSLPGTFVRTVKRMAPTVGTDKDSLDASGSWVVFVTRSAVAAERLMAIPDGVDTSKAAVAPWTDDYSDILGAMIRQRRASH